MYFVTARLVGLSGCDRDAQCLGAGIRAAAVPDDHVEHVYARPSRVGITCVVLVVADTLERAEATVHRLATQTAREVLPSYRLASCMIKLSAATAFPWTEGPARRPH